jgi:hypothetical protein
LIVSSARTVRRFYQAGSIFAYFKFNNDEDDDSDGDGDGDGDAVSISAATPAIRRWINHRNGRFMMWRGAAVSRG